MTVEEQIIINRNKTAVWTAITDIRHAAKSLIGIEKKLRFSTNLKNGLVGLKWRETRMYFGKAHRY